MNIELLRRTRIHEWVERTQRLIIGRGMAVQAAETVVDAAMFGHGCIEGDVRKKQEFENILEECMKRKEGWCRCGGKGFWYEQGCNGQQVVVRCDNEDCIARRLNAADNDTKS